MSKKWFFFVNDQFNRPIPQSERIKRRRIDTDTNIIFQELISPLSIIPIYGQKYQKKLIIIYMRLPSQDILRKEDEECSSLSQRDLLNLALALDVPAEDSKKKICQLIHTPLNNIGHII